MFKQCNRLAQNHFVKATKRSFFTLRPSTLNFKQCAVPFKTTTNLRYFSAGGDGDKKPSEEESKVEEEAKTT